MDAARREELLARYRGHADRLDVAAARARPAVDVADAAATPARVPARWQMPSKRELEVLQLVAEGLPNREIALRLVVTEETVKSHLRHLLAKLDVSSRARAVAVGLRLGLIK